MRLFLLVNFVTLLITNSVLFAGEKEGEMPSMEEMMADYMKMIEPGEAHRMLDFFIGDWTYTTKMWMSGHDQPPMESKGVSTSKWIMEDRFTETIWEGEFMGKPMKGRGLMGYNNHRKQYVSSWIDNMNTGISAMSGVYDKDAKVFRMWGTMDEPMTGEINKHFWMVYRITGDDTFVFEVHDSALGEKDTKVVEVSYTRK